MRLEILNCYPDPTVFPAWFGFHLLLLVFPSLEYCLSGSLSHEGLANL